MSLTTEPATVPLSTRFREETREEHERAETETFVEDLMAGRLDAAAYADLTAQHHAIYVALETAAEQVRSAPAGASIVFDELARVPSIESDLTQLVGEDWPSRIDVLPETKAYAARIAQVGADVGGYAAHAYTRYLGDLSGGQVVKRMLERHYGLGPEVLSFYVFEGIAKPKPFKDTYHERLDSLDLDEKEAAAAVAEARAAFEHNRAVFSALAKRHPARPAA